MKNCGTGLVGQDLRGRYREALASGDFWELGFILRTAYFSNQTGIAASLLEMPFRSVRSGSAKPSNVACQFLLKYTYWPSAWIGFFRADIFKNFRGLFFYHRGKPRHIPEWHFVEMGCDVEQWRHWLDFLVHRSLRSCLPLFRARWFDYWLYLNCQLSLRKW